MNFKSYRIFPLHTKAFLIEWKQEPSEALLEKLILFKLIIEKEPKVTRCHMGYKSLIVHIAEEIMNFNWWRERLKKLEEKIHEKKYTNEKKWKIPVCYEAKYAPDIALLAKALKLSIDELIQLHTKTRYRLYFIGFLPGFLYLGGLNKRLHHPRKEKPQLKVPKGSVGIGGKQTGIYPCNSPGGWHLIGNTPLNLFDITKQPPCFANSGDWISFEAIDQDTYKDLEKKIQKGDFKFDAL